MVHLSMLSGSIIRPPPPLAALPDLLQIPKAPLSLPLLLPLLLPPPPHLPVLPLAPPILALSPPPQSEISFLGRQPGKPGHWTLDQYGFLVLATSSYLAKQSR